jgi:hypothetical protein
MYRQFFKDVVVVVVVVLSAKPTAVIFVTLGLIQGGGKLLFLP